MAIQQGDAIDLTLTVRIPATRKRVEVDTAVVTLEDPSGSVILDEVAMTESDRGVYVYEYQLAEDAALGVWETYASVTRDGRVSVSQRTTFTVGVV